MSTLGSETTQPTGAVAETFAQHSKTLEAARNALNQICCSRNFLAEQDVDVPIQSVCVHLRIYFLKQADPDYVDLGYQDVKALLGHTIVQKPLDAYGNSKLFFASRTGAHVDIIIYLIENTVVLDVVNAEGQTFLFFLNTSNFNNSPCNCVTTQLPHCSSFAHSSSFECIIWNLTLRGFDFDHLDHHGRWFLQYLLYFKAFDFQWLKDLLEVNITWRERVGRMAQMRDSAGLFLSDFITSNPSWQEIGSCPETCGSLSLLTGATQSYPYSHALAQLMLEDSLGRTGLHQYIQEHFLLAPSNTLGAEPSDDPPFINRYNLNGRTPIMDFLEEAIKLDFSSPVIVAKLKVLVRYGANVNARSRGGNTVLYFAAGKARAGIISYLLTTGIQKDLRDKKGWTAYDYAFHLFKNSRKKFASAKKAIRSFQSLAAFEKENGQLTWLALEQRSSRACELLDTSNNLCFIHSGV